MQRSLIQGIILDEFKLGHDVAKATKNNCCMIGVLCNCGRIFFILSFFVGYILSFGLVRLRTIRLSARASAHIECRCSYSCAEDVTITNVIIKTPDRKCAGVWMTSWPEAMGWEFWWFLKKAVSWDSDRDEICRDLTLDETSWFLSLGEASWGLRDAPRVCWVSELRFWHWAESSAGELTEERCRNSQHSKNCVSLSSCRKN